MRRERRAERKPAAVGEAGLGPLSWPVASPPVGRRRRAAELECQEFFFIFIFNLPLVGFGASAPTWCLAAVSAFACFVGV